MKEEKKNSLEKHGWKVGSTEEFLGLSDQELAYIEIKLSLSRTLQAIREMRELTQQQMAQLVGSSQSRVAKMEAGDPSVSIDLQVRSLLALGASKDELADAIRSAVREAP